MAGIRAVGGGEFQRAGSELVVRGMWRRLWDQLPILDVKQTRDATASPIDYSGETAIANLPRGAPR